MFETFNIDPSLTDETSSTDLNTSKNLDESLPFDVSKDFTKHHSHQQKGTTLIKGERRLELGNVPFYLEEKCNSTHLPFK